MSSLSVLLPGSIPRCALFSHYVGSYSRMSAERHYAAVENTRGLLSTLILEAHD